MEERRERGKRRGGEGERMNEYRQKIQKVEKAQIHFTLAGMTKDLE